MVLLKVRFFITTRCFAAVVIEVTILKLLAIHLSQAADQKMMTAAWEGDALNLLSFSHALSISNLSLSISNLKSKISNTHAQISAQPRAAAIADSRASAFPIITAVPQPPSSAGS